MLITTSWTPQVHSTNLTKIAALFADCEIAFFIGASKKPGMVHELRIVVISLFASKANPEKVVGLLALVEYLNAETFGVVHVFDNVFRNLGFIGVGVFAYPDVYNA